MNAKDLSVGVKIPHWGTPRDADLPESWARWFHGKTPYEFSKGLINRRSSDGFSIELPSHRSWIQFQNSIRKIVISRSKPNQRTQNNNIGSYILTNTVGNK